MEVVHDGAAQMAEHEPEYGLEDFLGSRRHAGRVSQVGIGSRIIGGAGIPRHEEKKVQNPYLEHHKGAAPKSVRKLI